MGTTFVSVALTGKSRRQSHDCMCVMYLHQWAIRGTAEDVCVIHRLFYIDKEEVVEEGTILSKRDGVQGC